MWTEQIKGYIQYKNNDMALLLLRVVLGVVFFVHGAQKVFGLFGGSGLDKWVGFMENVNISKPIAIMAAYAEMIFGITLVLGIFTKVSALSAFIFMLFAIYLVHLEKGFFVNKGGYEYALVLAIASLSLYFSDGGKHVVDLTFTRN